MRLRCRGFSLIELMVSMVIGGGLIALSLQLFLVFSQQLSTAQTEQQDSFEAQQFLSALAMDFHTAMAFEANMGQDIESFRLLAWDRIIDYRRSHRRAHWERRSTGPNKSGEWRRFGHGKWQLEIDRRGEWYQLSLSLNSNQTWRRWVPYRSVNY